MKIDKEKQIRRLSRIRLGSPKPAKVIRDKKSEKLEKEIKKEMSESENRSSE